MPSSSKILRGLGYSSGDLMVLGLKHNFKALSTGAGDEQAGGADDIVAAVALEKAGVILEEAQNKAARIIRDAECKCIEAAEKLKKMAWEEGLVLGRKEALERATEEAAMIREKARQVLGEAQEIHKQTIEQMEPGIISLATEIAEKLLMARLSMDSDHIVKVAREAIRHMQDRGRVVLFVNPEERKCCEERKEDLAKNLSVNGELLIVSDPDISPGGCVVETEYGQVDARWETRWEAILKELGVGA